HTSQLAERRSGLGGGLRRTGVLPPPGCRGLPRPPLAAVRPDDGGSDLLPAATECAERPRRRGARTRAVVRRAVLAGAGWADRRGRVVSAVTASVPPVLRCRS